MDAGQKNYVGLLNEFAQRHGWTVQFDLVQTAGPDHIKTFTISIIINGKKYPDASGRNKKEARQNAAKNALDILENDETVNTETNSESCSSFSVVTQANFACWVNEYSQKRRLAFTTKETSKNVSGSNILTRVYACTYVCGDKEFPEATGHSKKEAKEAAAKCVYESLKEQEKEMPPEENGNGEENLNVHNLSTSLQLLELSATTDTTPTRKKNYIGLLNEYSQKTQKLYTFHPVERSGPAHDPQFAYVVVINNKKYPEGRGKTKQEAKVQAACLAWREIHDSDFSSQTSSSSWMSETPDNPSSSQSSSTQSKSESIIFANSVSKPLDVKPKRQIAANFQNSPVDNKKQSNIDAPNASTKGPTVPSETHSRFETEFDLISRIGKGGQGRVYKARRKLEDRTFAVKIVKFTKKSLREVTALSRLDHANIVRYHTSWTEETEYSDVTLDTYSSSSSGSGSLFLYIQMEFCEGETLHKWIDERNDHPEKYPDVRQEAAKTIIKQVLEAVKYIHSHKLVHRDLKPKNIMFGRDGGVKVGDFGLVTKDVEENDGSLLERSRTAGTRSYMSPEQRQKKYDRKVDIFPVGLIYFELLWQFGTKSEKMAHWENIRAKNFPEQFSISFVSEHTLIKEMLSEKPKDRPEAADLLMKLKQHEATTASKEHSTQKTLG